MKAIISVNFVKIGNVKVDDNLLKEQPQLMQVTEKAVKNICKALEKHYKAHKIEIEVISEIVKNK